MAKAADRATRIIVGALLGSSLSYAELRKVSKRLRFDKRWTQNLASLIEELGFVSGAALLSDHRADELDDLVEQCLAMMKRRKVSKIDALELLSKTGAKFKWKPNPKKPVRANIEALFSIVDKDDDRRLLVHSLAKKLGIEDDPYLRDLLER